MTFTTPQASRAAWNGLKGPLRGKRCLPPTLPLAAGSPSLGRGAWVSPEPCRGGSLGLGHPSRPSFVALGSAVPREGQEASWALTFLSREGPLTFIPDTVQYFH